MVWLFDVITTPGTYTIGYLSDGWTREMTLTVHNRMDAMMQIDRKLGSIAPVTYVEKGN